ncbi:MAG: 3-methyl-2-oxobutanoate dehydrogenase subunit VorB [Candidatus Omnitrophica bacterium]|nr:3-methyl-2-oxobutanoate dehydrogenase subunit VorB [Candidatus Omnitrophota bacterium]MDD5661547.1 3-methyl-2-oxobutanoate dehydrogenase subunit VorB [Candidatus Omnitrophota bacterium]
MPKILMSGNDAIAEGALRAGCSFYAGYPITPQNELTAYMANNMQKRGGVFIQAEAEVAAINMVFGASAAGARSMTSSSSPGISLKQEGISYIAGAELPAVIVNIMRGGPGLGNIAPSQSDYFQATRSGGHGDYHCIVLAPASVQESYDLTYLAFNLADKYRAPAIILGDGMLGQMMEPLELKNQSPCLAGRQAKPKTKPWALTGCAGRKANVVKSFYLKEGDLEKLNLKLQKKYQEITAKEQRWEELFLDDARVVLVAYGSMARIARAAVKTLRGKGRRVGLVRPVSLWPFPKKAFARPKNKYLVVEMSYGQMLEDVQLALCGEAKIEFLGRSGGGVPSEEEIILKINKIYNG